MDADVYGPSIPKMINLKGPVHLNKRKILLLFAQCNTTFLTVVCDAYGSVMLSVNCCMAKPVVFDRLSTVDIQTIGNTRRLCLP